MDAFHADFRDIVFVFLYGMHGYTSGASMKCKTCDKSLVVLSAVLHSRRNSSCTNLSSYLRRSQDQKALLLVQYGTVPSTVSIVRVTFDLRPKENTRYLSIHKVKPRLAVQQEDPSLVLLSQFLNWSIRTRERSWKLSRKNRTETKPSSIKTYTHKPIDIVSRPPS